MIEQVLTWFSSHAQGCKAPVLEVGSYWENGSVREMFPEPYTGLDMREGPGVDVVGDVLSVRFADGQFSTIVSTETLEHVTEPWEAVERMGRWLSPGGKMLISVPFHFHYHPYPKDYWRFSDDGLRHLFERAGLIALEVETIDTHTYGVATK